MIARIGVQIKTVFQIISHIYYGLLALSDFTMACPLATNPLGTVPSKHAHPQTPRRHPRLNLEKFRKQFSFLPSFIAHSLLVRRFPVKRRNGPPRGL